MISLWLLSMNHVISTVCSLSRSVSHVLFYPGVSRSCKETATVASGEQAPLPDFEGCLCPPRSLAHCRAMTFWAFLWIVDPFFLPHIVSWEVSHHQFPENIQTILSGIFLLCKLLVSLLMLLLLQHF